MIRSIGGNTGGALPGVFVTFLSPVVKVPGLGPVWGAQGSYRCDRGEKVNLALIAACVQVQALFL